MKLTLTQEELLKLLSKKTGFNVTSIEIVEEKALANQVREIVAPYDYNGSQKIMAIKALREASVNFKWYNGQIMGLADAKWAVEHFELFIKFIETNNRLPKYGYGGSNGLGNGPLA